MLVVLVEGSVDDVVEASFEDAHRFSAVIALGLAALEECSGAGVAAGLGDGDAVQGGVELAVAGAGEAVARVVPGPHRERGGAGVAGVGVG